MRYINQLFTYLRTVTLKMKPTNTSHLCEWFLASYIKVCLCYLTHLKLHLKLDFLVVIL